MGDSTTGTRGSGVVIEDVSALWELLTISCSPRELLSRSRSVIMEGLMLSLGALKPWTREPGLFDVLRSVRLDGYEVLAMQQGWGLFNPTRARGASSWAVKALTAQRTLESAAEFLSEALEAVELHPSSVRVVLIPGDPANRNFMSRCHGLSVAGFLPGVVLVQVWPSIGNLERINPALARAAAYQSASAAGTLVAGQRPATGTLLEIEALAAEVAQTLGACRREALWETALAAPPDHEGALASAALLCGESSYDALDTNVYGIVDEGEETRVPPFSPEQLAPDEVEYTLEALAGEVHETEPSRVAAAIYGDPAIATWGYQGIGISSLAGVQVAHRRARAGTSTQVPSVSPSHLSVQGSRTPKP